MIQYDYTKTPISIDRLTIEIQQSSMITALDHIDLFGAAVSIFFKADLSEADETTLGALVEAHDGTPLPENVVQSVVVASMPDPVPFAQPTYRTKRDAVGWITCPANATTDLDFQLTAERYVSGGQVIYKDVKEGDYVVAEVYDKDGVIPVPYRSAVCEAWPSVAKYIVKKYLKPCVGYDELTIDTYPLNAKITAGLYLRVSLVTTAEEGDRKMAINYHLTKKL